MYIFIYTKTPTFICIIEHHIVALSSIEKFQIIF